MSACPTANEFGVRDNPVCVDSVDTTPFVNITSVDFTDIGSLPTSSGNVAVSIIIASVHVVTLFNGSSSIHPL